jgi:hypothetical protein
LFNLADIAFWFGVAAVFSCIACALWAMSEAAERRHYQGKYFDLLARAELAEAFCRELSARPSVGPEQPGPVDDLAASRRGGPYAAIPHLAHSSTTRGPD